MTKCVAPRVAALLLALLPCAAAGAGAANGTAAKPEAAAHWAFRPPSMPAVPAVKRSDWPRTDVDRFVLATLEAKGLSPAPPADPLTLIRRATFDVTGLPPTPEEVEAFLNDSAPDAYEKLVDRLLASPHYGERWGRHWLDVVRFGESQGFERNRIRDNAWRYRDWVIGAFNRDLPYDEFVRHQIAGDVLHPSDPDAVIATGYHVVGSWDQVAHLEGSGAMKAVARADALEDLVATMGQAYLGLTINCARCHDHKFDPVARKEYYQVAALLAGVTQAEKERENVALSRDPKREATVRAELNSVSEALANVEAKIRKSPGGESAASADAIDGVEAVYRIDDEKAVTIADASGAAGGVELRVGAKPRWASAEPPLTFVRAAKAAGAFSLEAWLTPAKAKQAGPARIVTLSLDSGRRNFTLGHDGTGYEVRLRTTKTDANGLPSLRSPGGSAKAERTHVVYTFGGDGAARLYVNGRRVAERSIGGDLSNWDDSFRLGLGDELTGDRAWDGRLHFVALYSRALDEATVLRNFDSGSRDVGSAATEPLLAKASPAERARHGDLLSKRKALQEELASLHFTGALHVPISQQPPVTNDLHRGDLNSPKGVVSPAGVAALGAGGLPSDFGLPPDAPEARRRAKLAEWLTDPRNPLTARVFVNRVWHYHFGQGIVDTPSDFGTQGGRPSHPELLDYLAVRFVRGGWRAKDLHRLIMTSAAYRQASQVRDARAEAVDADNRLLWRFNRRRLDGEAVRDAALAASGALNRRMGGPSYRDMKVEFVSNNHGFTEPTNEFSDATRRRTVYRLWARSGGQPMLESLDCPDPSVMTPRRTLSITPVQALSMLNNVFMEQCADRFAKRAAKEAGDDDVPGQVERAYRLALCRPPTRDEAALAAPFVREHGLGQFCLVLFNANEFLFVN